MKIMENVGKSKHSEATTINLQMGGGSLSSFYWIIYLHWLNLTFWLKRMSQWVSIYSLVRAAA